MSVGNPGDFPNAPVPSNLDILKNSSPEGTKSSLDNFLQRVGSEVSDEGKKGQLLSLGQELDSKLSSGTISNEEAITSLAGLYDPLGA